jgi:hypothetical protein
MTHLPTIKVLNVIEEGDTVKLEVDFDTKTAQTLMEFALQELLRQAVLSYEKEILENAKEDGTIVAPDGC